MTSTCSTVHHNQALGGSDRTETQLAESEHPGKVIIRYLRERSAEFRGLEEIRKRGWDKPQGDVHFQNQRRNADHADSNTSKYFFKLMGGVARELHESANAFKINPEQSQRPSILDMCMAPGGFLETALSYNPEAEALAFSLPPSIGGHQVLMQADSAVEQRFLDVTMLAADMGIEEIPESHQDASNFLPRQLKSHQLFDLVLCDGQVLRTHKRPSYREYGEARRLSTAQLAIGLEHLRPGGTMVVLLHKLEAWSTVNILWRFSRFSSLKVLKPRTSHVTRSSFYMIATKIQGRHPEAIRAIQSWKMAWKAATFDLDDEYKLAALDGELSAEELLDNFGSDLVTLGRPVWKTQAQALEKAPWMRSGA
ncbi:hypothetical protein M426DRAFT_57814 [Hypoxylon sp. CI-4A]|nr:hypothetical protein M426DRAFT_57814 [Hypoxylon sp. CI-4A]